MDDIINSYIFLLTCLEEMDLKTLNDIKFIGNSKNKSVSRILKVLEFLPKTKLLKMLGNNEKENQLEMQARLAYWTFKHIQDNLGCTTLSLEKEPESVEEINKLYDYFNHLILMHKDKEIKNVVSINNNMLFIDEDGKVFSDNYKDHIIITECPFNSFITKANMILEALGIDQKVDPKTKQFININGPLIYSDVDQNYFVGDSKEIINILAVYKDGAVRHIIANNYSAFKEVPCKSLKTLEIEKEKSASRKRELN